jgi:hypothetical protein
LLDRGAGRPTAGRGTFLNVDGTRLVITGDFPGTSPADRAEMDAIVDSIVIEP